MLIIKFNDPTTAFSFLCPPLSTSLAQAWTPSHLCHDSRAGLWFHSISTFSVLPMQFWSLLETQLHCYIAAMVGWLLLVGWLRAEPLVGHSRPSMMWPQLSFAVFPPTHPLTHVLLGLPSRRTEMHVSPSFCLCPFAHAAATCPFTFSHLLRSCCKFLIQPSREK